jgi:hypothetical protein
MFVHVRGVAERILGRSGGIVVLCLLSLSLNLWHLGFPLGYHYDESKKVRFIASHEQDFHHPLLMLDLARVANAIAGERDPQRVVVLGRTITAAAGTLGVAVLYLLARRMLGPAAALGAALVMASAPIVVVHAHYLKEDTYLVSSGLLVFLAVYAYIGRPSGWRATVVGAALGTAASTHYKSLVLVAAVAMPIVLTPRLRTTCCQPARLLAISGAAAATFLAWNYPAVMSPDRLLNGMASEGEHAVWGHFVPIYWYHYWGGYHLVHSVMPGMTWPVSLGAVAAAMWFTARWRGLAPVEQMLLLYGWLSYIIPEVSPLKPPPDDARYVLPLIPVLCYFLAKGVDRLSSYATRGRTPVARVVCAASLALVCVLSCLTKTVGIVSDMADDTRAKAERWVNDMGYRAVYETMASASLTPERQPWGHSLDLNRLRLAGYTHFVASSFAYDMYFRGESLSDQSPSVKRRAAAYRRLLQGTVHEIRPAHETFAFSNPIIRIVDLSKQ